MKPAPSIEQPATAKRPFARFWVTVLAALAVQMGLGLHAASRLTTTHDEYWHLPVGLLNLRTGRFHFDNLNPPLCRVTAALPLVFTAAQSGQIDSGRDAMDFGDAFLEANRQHFHRWFVLGRMMIVIITALAGLVTAIWARELFGMGAGCLAVLLWAFEPNLIAHGSLVTTDMGAAAFFVFTLYALWKFACRPSWTTSIVFGIALGLAQLSKFTCLLLYPLSVAAFLIIVAARKSGQLSDEAAPAFVRSSAFRRPHSPSSVTGMWLAALVLSVAVLNAGHLFRGSFSTLRSYDFQSASLQGLGLQLRSVGWLPVPLPRDYVEGLDHQRRIMEQQHPVFLNGEWSEKGFPNYYLWTLLYKLPLALQLLCVTTLLWLIVPEAGRRPAATKLSRSSRHSPSAVAGSSSQTPAADPTAHGERLARRPWLQLLILLPAIVMIGVAGSSGMQLGVRYVLPAIPFLILFASQSARWFDLKTFPFRTLTTGALTAWMLLSVRYAPEHLAYFNELAGGPLGGRECLLDSNLDWGQDLAELKDYLQSRQIGKIGLAYFGTVRPAALGIIYHIPASRNPEAGLFAVSVNFEQGRPHWVRTPRGEIRPVDIGEFAYFQMFKPVARIGASIDVFRLTDRDIADWRSAIQSSR